MKRHFAVAVAVATVAACAPTKGTAPGESGGHCEARTSKAPPGAAPPDTRAPSSRLVVEARARTSALSREIQKRVPRTLASVRRRPSGAIGDVSYVVTRGAIAINLKGEKLVATVPVAAQVEVCKPLGPLCIRYGTCNPRLAAHATVPLVLGDNYNLGRARASVALTRSCIIAGFNAGPEIRKIARRQIGGIERQINAAVPPFRPYVNGAWQLLHVPVALSRNTCLKIEPEALSQSPPRQKGGVVSMRLAAMARASFEEPCADSESAAAPSPLPTRRIDKKLPSGSELRVPLRLGWEDVSAELSRSVRGSAGKVAVLKVAASGQLSEGAPRVRLDVTVDGTVCGEASLVAEPFYDKERGRIRLRGVRGLGASLRELRPVLERIERLAEVPVAVDTSAAARGLTRAVESAVGDLPKNVKLDLSVQPAEIGEVVAEARGISAVLRVRGTARVGLD